MNRGHVLQSMPVQQMMAGNPNWWNMNNMRQESPQQSSHLLPSSSTLVFPHYIPPSSSPLPMTTWNDSEDLPGSWSQLLQSGIVGEEDRSGLSQFQAKKLENWEEQILFSTSSVCVPTSDVKQEVCESPYAYGHGNEEFQPSWSHQVMATSPPKSCVTSFSSNSMLDFSNNKASNGRHHPQPEHSSECNSTATGGASKKARVQPSSAPTTFKVRKEKLGDRITALHQLVSPFGKTDTASVLLEAIGYIRFLQNQIEALSTPYLGNGSASMRQQHQSVQGENNCIFPEDPGQLLNDNCLKRKGGPDQVSENEPKKDLKSRGLCLVPVSCTLQVGSDNGADYWAPAFGGGFR